MNANIFFTTKQLLNMGYSKYQINTMCINGKLEKINYGVYMKANQVEVPFIVFLKRYKNMILSNESALYIHDLTTDFPSNISVTVKKNIRLNLNTQYLKENKIEVKVYYVKDELFCLGLEEIEWNGETIQIYDKERTICDIVRNRKRITDQIYYESIQQYFLWETPDKRKLLSYAKQLNIDNKIVEIMNLFLQP